MVSFVSENKFGCKYFDELWRKVNPSRWSVLQWAIKKLWSLYENANGVCQVFWANSQGTLSLTNSRKYCRFNWHFIYIFPQNKIPLNVKFVCCSNSDFSNENCMILVQENGTTSYSLYACSEVDVTSDTKLYIEFTLKVIKFLRWYCIGL